MNMDKRTVEVLGLEMAYTEAGEGDPIVFLHGNPTSSYLWRNIIPYAEGMGRCIAPDLIGMGDSGKLAVSGPDAYTFSQHREYLDLMLDKLGVDGAVTFVAHDWGSALGFDWAARNPGAMKGLAYMEAIVTPVTWEDWPEAARNIFQSMRSEAGETIVLEKNVFVERILPASIQRKLTDEEMAEYRRPFTEPGEGRRTMLTWPRQIPVEGEPADVHQVVERYSAQLAEWDLPKLFVNADPGSILTGRPRRVCREWPNQTEVTVPGLHFIQEDSPDLIGQALADWLEGLS